MSITLYICDAGVQIPGGPESLASALAQELANLGGVAQEVRAPNGRCGIDQNSPYSPWVESTKDKRPKDFYTDRKYPKK